MAGILQCQWSLTPWGPCHWTAVQTESLSLKFAPPACFTLEQLYHPLNFQDCSELATMLQMRRNECTLGRCGICCTVRLELTTGGPRAAAPHTCWRPYVSVPPRRFTHTHVHLIIFPAVLTRHLHVETHVSFHIYIFFVLQFWYHSKFKNVFVQGIYIISQLYFNRVIRC